MVNSDQKFTKKVMHTFPETGAGVPAFLAKLWRLVEDPETNNLICWSKDGRSFIIQNQAQFAHDLLPLNYKHNNMASFIRQLNMYGFHKITSIDNGGLKFDRDEMEFTHPCFKRNCPYLLEHIKRKIATNKVDDKATVKPEAVSKVLQDVKAMRGRQDSLDTRFSVMKQENEALWREIASLRQKHAKQQQIVNKLIQFLITIVQPQRNMTSVKRHMQLMINDAPGSASKMRKTSESETNCGPIIHELSEELLDEVADSEIEIMIPNSPFSEATTPTHRDLEKANSPEAIERPQSSASMMSQHHDFSNHGTEEMMGYGNGNTSNNSIAANNREALIHAVDPDGSPFYYHVTEVNDAHPSEMNTVGAASAFNDDNVLTTPMVREVMAFKKMINENIQRRSKSATNSPTLAKSQIPDEKIARKNGNTKTEPEQNPQTSFQIKAEQEMDPMLFLNVYANNQDGSVTRDPNQISPNIRESTLQSNKSVTHDVAESYVSSTDVSGPTNAPKKTAMLNTVTTTTTTTTNDLYDPNDFITKDMPVDLFEDTSMISSGDNSNISCENFKIFRSQQQQQQETVGNISTATTTKLSPHISIVGKRNGNNMASTSGAANARDNTNKEKEIAAVPTTSKDASSNNTNNMALTKYRQNEDIMRLSTADEFSNHLDCIQDELESLKDMLRNDNYSLDSNTLLGNFLNDSIISNDDLRSIQKGMLKNNTLAFNNAVEIINRIIITPGSLEGDNLDKLFNDSELLGACGFSFATDNIADKKGSELISCQPIYDLTDIINDQNDLDDDNVGTTAAGYEQAGPVPTTPSSVLNTPRHE